MAHTVKIEFDSEEKANGFLRWLCNSGEQEYFDQAQYGNIEVAEQIDYFQGGDRFGGSDGLTAVAK
jgi:hypothetical protein